MAERAREEEAIPFADDDGATATATFKVDPGISRSRRERRLPSSSSPPPPHFSRLWNLSSARQEIYREREVGREGKREREKIGGWNLLKFIRFLRPSVRPLGPSVE